MFSPRRWCTSPTPCPFGDVWRRPQLSPKERSLVTVAALTAGGNADQLSSHLQYAKDDGATEEELIEAITHLSLPRRLAEGHVGDGRSPSRPSAATDPIIPAPPTGGV